MGHTDVKTLCTLLCILAVDFCHATQFNIAQGKQTTVSSMYPVPARSDWSHDKAVDGCNNTDLNGNCCFHTAIDGRNWLTIDLGKTYNVRRVSLIGRQDCCGEQSGGYVVYGLMDQEKNPLISTNKEVCFAFPGDATLGVATERDCQNSQLVTQYVSILKNDPGYMSFCEIEIEGCSDLNCVACSAEDTCTECVAGYRAVNGQCENCTFTTTDNVTKVDTCPSDACGAFLYDSIVLYAADVDSIDLLCLDSAGNPMASIPPFVPSATDTVHHLSSNEFCFKFKVDINWKSGASKEARFETAEGCSKGNCKVIYCDNEKL